MAILLIILKIIGIVLASALGLIILIILYLLLAPFWFKASVIIDRSFNYNIAVKATTFLRFIQFHLNLGKDISLNYHVSIFGPYLNILSSGGGDDDSDDSDDSDDTRGFDDEVIDSDSDGRADESDLAEESDDSKREAVDTSAEDSVLYDESDDSDDSNDSYDTDNSDESGAQKSDSISDDTKDSWISKLNPSHLIDVIRSKVDVALSKVSKIREQSSVYLSAIRDPNNKAWLKKVLTHLKKLIKSMKINLRGTRLDFSMGEPDVTGKVTGALALFSPIYDKKVSISPDFSDYNMYFNGNVDIKGRIKLVSVVYFVLVVLLDSNTKKIIKLLKREES